MKNGNSYLKTIRYDNTGKILWEDIHDGDATATEKTTGLLIAEDGIVNVTGVIQLSPTDQEYEVITYKPYEHNVSIASNADGGSSHINDEVIIRFYPKVIDTLFADNQGLLFGTVDEIITDNNLINLMDAKLNANGNLRDWKMIKQYPFLLTSERTMKTKFGTTVSLNSLWTTYRLVVENSMDESAAADSLNTLDQHYVLYAVIDPVAELSSSKPAVVDADDSYYLDYQAGLHGLVSGFPDAHINIEPAWDDDVDGDPSIRVGVIDTGCNFDHPDFGTTFEGLNGSVVEFGYDFTTGTVDPFPFDDNYTFNDPDWGHGTRIAGIIGAVRCNDEGVSGVAGGNYSNSNVNERQGVSLAILKAGEDIDVPLSQGSRALVFAATGGDDTGVLEPIVDILNSSWGKAEVDFEIPPDQLELDTWMRESLYCPFKAGIITHFSRGNYEPLQMQEGEVYHTPGTLNDKWLITVGGNGNDGNLKTLSNTSTGTTNFYKVSKYGFGMDFIAPATNDLIVTINNQDDGGFSMDCPQQPNNLFDGNWDYTCFNGTSSAVAIASGVSALLLEHHNEQHETRLTHEDVERLLEYGTTDLGVAGYDDLNGWGRLNAGASVDLITDPQRVVHLQYLPNKEVICDDPVNNPQGGGESCFINLDYFYETAYSDYEGTGVFPANTLWYSKIFKYSADVNFNVCDYGATFVDPGMADGKYPVWVDNSLSNLWGEPRTLFTSTVVPEEDIFWETGPFIDGCTLTGTLVGYSYELIDENPGIEIGEVEKLPNPENDPYQMWISLLVDDPNDGFDDGVITGIDVEPFSGNKLKVYPNPVQTELNVLLETEIVYSVTTLKIYDVNGRLISVYTNPVIHDTSQVWGIDTSSYPLGTYILQVESLDEVYTSKFVKL